MSLSVLVIGGFAVLVVIALLIPLFLKINKMNLLPTTDEKPEYMRDLPPAESIAATTSDGEGVTIFDFDHGEKLAAPFAEQIEDILRAKIKADTALQQFGIDFGTSEDQALEIWVNGKKYASVNDLPDERLKEAFRASVEKWNTV